MSDGSKKDIRHSSTHDVNRFLSKVRNTPLVKAASQKGRLMFGMDATASREASWDQACQIQGEMFTETTALGGLEVQLCYYRGFNEFSASPWHADSRQLLQTMSTVTCLGGHTQIEKLIQHAIETTRQHKINALVFVGDCLEEPVDRLCQLAGELGLRGVPMFIFHEGGEPVAAAAFRQMAQLSRGAYCPFDAGSARQLRDLLSAVAVYAAGGQQALDDFQKRKGISVLQLMHKQ